MGNWVDGSSVPVSSLPSWIAPKRPSQMAEEDDGVELEGLVARDGDAHEEEAELREVPPVTSSPALPPPAPGDVDARGPESSSFGSNQVHNEVGPSGAFHELQASNETEGGGELPPSAVAADPGPNWALECEALTTALANLAAEAARARRVALEASEGDLVQLATAIAEQVIRRELATDPKIIAEWARDGLQSMLDKDSVVIAISPDLAEKVPFDVWARVLETKELPEVDETLKPLSCEIRGKYSKLHIDAETRIESVVAAMGAPST